MSSRVSLPAFGAYSTPIKVPIPSPARNHPSPLAPLSLSAIFCSPVLNFWFGESSSSFADTNFYGMYHQRSPLSGQQAGSAAIFPPVPLWVDATPFV
jgi:hypothetical protein